MLFEIEPSVDVTGGPWFSDNELDSEFIDGLCKAAFKYIGSKVVHVYYSLNSTFHTFY